VPFRSCEPVVIVSCFGCFCHGLLIGMSTYHFGGCDVVGLSERFQWVFLINICFVSMRIGDVERMGEIQNVVFEIL
jgi:hypothetical protein